jgi:hypothetical protein
LKVAVQRYAFLLFRNMSVIAEKFVT